MRIHRIPRRGMQAHGFELATFFLNSSGNWACAAHCSAAVSINPPLGRLLSLVDSTDAPESLGKCTELAGQPAAATGNKQADRSLARLLHTQRPSLYCLARHSEANIQGGYHTPPQSTASTCPHSEANIQGGYHTTPRSDHSRREHSEANIQGGYHTPVRLGYISCVHSEANIQGGYHTEKPCNSCHAK